MTARCTYSGIALSHAPKKIAHWMEAHFPVSDPAHRFRQRTYPLPYAPGMPFIQPPTPPMCRPGRLHWPRGAARWSIGYFFASQNQLDKIRALVYKGNSYTAQDLVLNDGKRTSTTSLWMLPPRQVSPRAGGVNKDKKNALYLLELVDNRYFWWTKTGSISITEGTTTWAQVFAAIGTLLGETIVVDSINAAYLHPPASLVSGLETVNGGALPLLLDAVASCVGHRLVRQLDGTVESLNATTSQSRQQAEILLNRSRQAGNLFNFGA